VSIRKFAGKAMFISLLIFYARMVPPSESSEQDRFTAGYFGGIYRERHPAFR
jgi:hypothetical protein